jgi:hypothetical protein
MEIQQASESKIPSHKSNMSIKGDPSFFKFLKNVIICTEQGYNKDHLKELAKKPHTLEYKNNYIELITKVIEELLYENKINKL